MKWSFIHIPRTGGNTVESWMSSPGFDGLQNFPEDLPHRHYRYVEVQEKLKRRTEPYKLFTVVRNPYDWHVSFYCKLKEGGIGLLKEQNLCRSMTFPQWIYWIDSGQHTETEHCYPRWSFKDWICDASGNLVVDKVLRTETLKEDFESAFGIQVKQQRVSSTSRGAYREYYNAQAREIVSRRHEWEFKTFGYSW